MSADRRLVRVAAVAALLVAAARASAHELRPAYLELTEVASARYDVIWKVPTRGGGLPLAGEEVAHPGSAAEGVDSGEPRTMPCGCPLPPASDTTFAVLPIHPALPAEWRVVTPARLEQLPGAVIRRWTVVTGEQAPEGAAIAVHGLDVATVDVLVRIALADGRVVSRLLRPGAASFTIETGVRIPVFAYLRLGMEHILFGIDHLLFVLALILLVGSIRLLVKTITAFTLAHSITLALATLDVVRVPQAPVEAVIALSIVFLASELVRPTRGETGRTSRQPWLVAFVFGLLHGLGFAGALSEVGLPSGDVPAALFLFNVGVEVGQLAFVAAMLALIAVARQLSRAGRWLEAVPAYAIGSLATFWLMQHIADFWPNG